MKLETKTAATKSGRKIICQLNGKTGIVSVDGGIMGRVVDVIDGDMATVRWDSLVVTDCPIEFLSVVEE